MSTVSVHSEVHGSHEQDVLMGNALHVHRDNHYEDDKSMNHEFDHEEGDALPERAWHEPDPEPEERDRSPINEPADCDHLYE